MTRRFGGRSPEANGLEAMPNRKFAIIGGRLTEWKNLLKPKPQLPKLLFKNCTASSLYAVGDGEGARASIALQNVLSSIPYTRRIDYAPPEPGDVPSLMRELVQWLSSTLAAELPAPIRAAILTHRFLSIHPFNDGNGRTGRLLATAELWRSSYRMRGFFSFEEYFNADRDRYYQNLQMGLPVNFYDGCHDPDHTPWVLYFVETMARAADELQVKAKSLYQGATPEAPPWESLPRLQQQVLTRLLARILDGVENPFVISPSDIAVWFGVSDNTAREWLKEWVEDGFINPILTREDKRIRSYTLAEEWMRAFFQNNDSQTRK